MSDSQQQLMDVKSVARTLDCSTNTVRRMVARGELPQPMRVGLRLLRWDKDAIQAWIENSGEQPGQEEIDQMITNFKRSHGLPLDSGEQDA